MTIRVLITDDDEKKFDKVRDAVLGGAPDAIVRHAASVNAAKTYLKEGHYDLLVVDLALPLLDRGLPDPDGGTLLISQLKSFDCARMHVVALTAFATLAEDSELQLKAHCVQVVQFEHSGGTWAETLARKARGLARAGDERIADACVMCALRSPELEELLALPLGWEQTRQPLVAPLLYRGTLRIEGGEGVRVLALATGVMGMPATASITTAICHAIRPRLIVMTGIAAGLRRDEMNPGDILVANQVFDYGAGRVSVGDDGTRHFEAAMDPILLDYDLDGVVQSIQHDRVLLRKIQLEYEARGKAWHQAPRVFIGPFGSGAAVVKDPAVGEQLRQTHRKAVGLEMEAYGVHAGVRYGTTRRPACLVVKSVVDYGDAQKSDDFQGYASYTSARFALAVIERLALQNWP